MRKGILAAIVAAALFAVGAFAATFNVTSEDVASGSDSFVACAEDVDVDFDTGGYDTESGDFSVTGATATFSGGEGCDGKDATLVVLGIEGEELGSSSATVDGSTAFFELDELVGDVYGAAVLVEGNAIDTANA